MPFRIARIIDANLDRATEGLRVLEDTARFILNDRELAEELKRMRHGIAERLASVTHQLLSGRDAEADVGAATSSPGSASYPDLISLVRANARRVAESLRVLAEVSRCEGSGFSVEPSLFEQARFQLYSIDKKLVSKLMRQDKVGRIRGVYAVLDAQYLGGKSAVEVAKRVIQGGARVVQLRDKSRGQGQLLQVAKQLSQVCHEAGVLFIVNDYPDVALASDADGVHLGQEDLSVEVARDILRIDKIIGCTANTVAEALQAEEQGADYVAVSAVYATRTKSQAEVAGLETLRQVRERLSVPVVAIGGINRDNIREVAAAGVAAVAVISAILDRQDVELATRELADALSGGEIAI